MKRGEFTVDGVSSINHGILIQDRPDINIPQRRLTFATAYGRSGSIPFNEDQDNDPVYENTTMALILLLEGGADRTPSQSREGLANFLISNWYKDFVFYFDETKIYQMMSDTEQAIPVIQKRYFGNHAYTTMNFTVLPWKYLTDAPLKTLTAAGSLTNPTTNASKPIIKIYGTGDVTLKIGSQSFVIKNIVDNIIIDTEQFFAYKKSTAGVITNENAKVYTREYPYLLPGANAISWTGTVTKVEIQPRWRVIA